MKTLIETIGAISAELEELDKIRHAEILEQLAASQQQCTSTSDQDSSDATRAAVSRTPMHPTCSERTQAAGDGNAPKESDACINDSIDELIRDRDLSRDTTCTASPAADTCGNQDVGGGVGGKGGARTTPIESNMREHVAGEAARKSLEHETIHKMVEGLANTLRRISEALGGGGRDHANTANLWTAHIRSRAAEAGLRSSRSISGSING